MNAQISVLKLSKPLNFLFSVSTDVMLEGLLWNMIFFPSRSFTDYKMSEANSVTNHGINFIKSSASDAVKSE